MRRALLLSTALLLAACGGDDEKAAYVEQATAVCQKAAAEKDALKAPGSDLKAYGPYAQSLVEIAERAQSDLAALEPPADDRAEFEERVLEPFGDVVDEGRAFAAKVQAADGDQAKLLPLLSQIPDAGEVDLEYLRSYGLGTCADVIEQA